TIFDERLDVPQAKSCCSSSNTLRPRRAASSRMPAPVMPPPITIRSQCCPAKVDGSGRFPSIFCLQQATGVQLPGWIKVVCQCAQRGHALRGFLMLQPGRVITTDAMLVTDGATDFGNRITGGGFHCRPAGASLFVTRRATEHISGIDTGTLRVQV